ncbi:hypothetical protein O3G_MSEX005086 [Manduca sexta]|uniref:Ku domain-containing protein n=1 Tax=Manduca sexta TaxID=7130 RepID=A0A922CJ00_MANSE|nr:hypothetical protein O3G_MSEX005086 [Manduca sexta]
MKQLMSFVFFNFQASNKSGDWVEALAVAVDHVVEVKDFNFTNIKIILLTNFMKPTRSKKNIQMILDGIKDEKKIEVDVIGPDLYDTTNNSPDLEWAREFVKETNGVAETIESTMNFLLFHKKKTTKPQPWNVDLTIGPYIKIPVTAYIRLNDDKIVEKWTKTIKDPVTSKSSSTTAVVRDKGYYDAEKQAKVDESEVTKAHEFGGQTVPSSESDKFLQYQPGDKSLSLYGFTNANNIHWQHFDGKGLHYVFERKGDKKAQLAIKCLIEILHENKLVGVVRKVHNNNNAPKMFALMPVIDTNNYMCLSMVSLCYKEAIKYMPFPPTNIRKYSCTKDQVDAFKYLIRTMDLTNSYDDTFDDAEAFPAGETVSPSAQYLLDCIAYRALNPEKPLPQPRDEIMDLFKIPPMVEKRCQDAQEKIKKLFPLKKVEEKPKRRTKRLLYLNTSNDPSTIGKPHDNTNNSGPKIALPKADDSDYTIGTINPVRDFSALLGKGKSLVDLAPDMTEVIESLLYYNLDGVYTKAITTMTHFRGECVKTDPSIYNNWLLKFKVDLSNRNRGDLLTLIKEKGVDFILKSENNLSTFEKTDSHEESQLYEMDTVPESTEVAIKPEVYDMFDDI